MSIRNKPRLHRDWIDPFAINIVQRLQEKGFESYLVGGCVRDLLAGQRPKDFDIVTSARPEQIKRTIPRAYIIGKRFRLVLVKRGEDQFEVATFRRDPPAEESRNEEGLQISDNVFGTPEEDARRRDFTVNSMFYDPIADQVLDFCEGLKDIEERVIRIIGDPKVRLTEDPIRILRALRLAHKLDFSIEASLRSAMVEKANLLTSSVLPRRREEMLKILRLKDPAPTLHECHDLGILQHAFPTLDRLFSRREAIDDFESYLSQIHRFSPNNFSEPNYLFGILILAYYRSMLQHDPLETALPESAERALNEFMKQELGIFNLEASNILRAIRTQPELAQTSDFRRRGARRRRGFLRSEALPLALAFAELDHVLSASDLKFWRDELKSLSSHPEAERDRRPRSST